MNVASLSAKQQRMLARASSIAEASTCNQRHGAIVVKGGRVLSVGINRDKNHPENVPHPKTQAAVHAEVAAVKACGDVDLHGATIYVARVNRAGDQMMSKPCERCQAFLRERGIKKIFYTIDSSMDLV